MTDQFDRASELEQLHREQAIQRVLNQAKRPSRETCLDCDEPIPPQRRQIGGVVRCIKCQRFFEIHEKNHR